MTNFKACFVLALSLAACASDDGKPTADGKTCDGSFVMDVSPIGDSGPNQVAGTVMLPRMLAAGTVVGIQFEFDTDTHESNSQAFQLPAAAASMTYRVTNVPANATNLLVEVQADATGDGSTIDDADFDGYFDGSSTSPILDPANAKTIALTGGCVPGVNFGVGPRTP